MLNEEPNRNSTPIGSDGRSDTTLRPRLHPDDLDAIITAVRVTSPPCSCVSTPWLSAEEVAHYLRCPLSRVRKLTMTDELPHEHDGRRVLYHRDALDAYILDGGAICP